MEAGQLTDLGGIECATFALLRRRATGTPHEIVSNQHLAAFERIQQRHRTLLSDERGGATHRHHREPATGSRNRVAYVRVGLLSNPQCIEFGFKNGPVDHVRGRTFIRD